VTLLTIWLEFVAFYCANQGPQFGMYDKFAVDLYGDRSQRIDDDFDCIVLCCRLIVFCLRKTGLSAAIAQIVAYVEGYRSLCSLLVYVKVCEHAVIVNCLGVRSRKMK
jgi:hypothetical protein